MAWDDPYLDPQDLRARIQKRSASDDTVLLAPVILAASRLVDKAAGGRFNQYTGARFYDGSGHVQIRVDNLVSLSALAYDTNDDGGYAGVLAADEYVLLPLNAAADGEPYTHIRLVTGSPITLFPERPSLVRATGVHGWPAVPALVKEWTALIARQMIDLHEAGSTQTLEAIDSQVQLTPGFATLTKEIRRQMSRRKEWAF